MANDESYRDLELFTAIRSALDSPEPLDLLALASSLVAASTALPHPFQDEPEPAINLSDLIESFLDIAQPETDSLLLVLAEMLDDEILRRKIVRQVKPRVDVLPAWIAELERLKPHRAMALRSLTGETETIVIEVKGPRGVFTLMVALDLLAATLLEDAYPLSEALEDVLEGITQVPLVGLEIQPISLADARARIAGALEMNDRTYPPIETDTWPSIRPMLLWLLHDMPAGGQPISHPEWTMEEIEAFATEFLTATPATGLDREAFDQALLLMDFAGNYGTGDPRQWGPLLVERVLLDLIPRKLNAPKDYILPIPGTLSALVEFSHQKLGLPEEVTAQVLDTITECLPDFHRLIDQGGTGLAHLINQSGISDEDLLSALERGDPEYLNKLLGLGGSYAISREERMLAEVGGPEGLDTLDDAPLPTEQIDLTAVPEDIHDRVHQVAQLAGTVCLTFFNDTEMQTSAFRTLARIATTDPEIFRRRGKTATAAAALCWIVGWNNDWFDSYDPKRTVQSMMRSFGLSGSPSQRAQPMLRALDPALEAPYRIALGDPSLLTSKRRRTIMDSLGEE